jgi:SAM-dependent methyltransferase
MSTAILGNVKQSLVCPRHHIPFTSDGSVSMLAEVPWPDGAVKCPEGCEWVVRGGIPRFVNGSSYASSFGVQWNRYTRTELDSHTGMSYSRNRLERCLGAPLESLRGKVVLECGSGAGRFTELLIRHCEALVCIDVSSAVDANFRNCHSIHPYLIMQGDINASPLPQHYFDVVVCLGVIQHTPNPEVTMRNLARHLKPGGHLVIDHYTRDRGSKLGNLISYLDYIDMVYPIRAVLKRMKPEHAMRATRLLTAFCDPIRKRTSKIVGLDKIVRRLFPTACYYTKFPKLDPKFVYEINELDTMDWLTDYYKFFRSPKQIRTFLESLGLVVESCQLGGNGVEARARASEMVN